MKEKLMAIRATLNQVEVRGAENWDRLLGCVQALNALIGAMQADDTERSVEE